MVETVCRICLEQPKAPLKRVWPLEEQHGEHTYGSMFTEVSGFPVFEHEPPAICGGCRLQLIDSFEFKMKCQRSQQMLVGYVEATEKDKEIKTELLDIETEQILETYTVRVLHPLSEQVEVLDSLNKPIEFVEKVETWEESSEEVEIKDEVMEEALDGGLTNQSFANGGDNLLVEIKEQKEEPTKKFRCNSCEYAVKCPYALQRHLKKVHPELENSCCPCCRALIFPELKQHHLETCSKNPTMQDEAQQNNWLTCIYCGDQSKWFRCEKTLTAHCYAKHKDQRSLSACRLCNNFFFLELLKNHERECKDYIVECQHCQKSFAFHQQKNHLKDCSQNPANKEEALLNNYLTCEMCGKTSRWYKDAEQLLAHKIAYHRSASCQYCEMACYPDQLEKHESSCSKNANKYLSCDHCFPTKIWCKTLGSLERHLTKAHPERPTTTCQYCRRITFSELLADHEGECSVKQMKGRKPRLCPLCGKFFNSKFLNQHIATVHERQSSQPRPQFICDLCNHRCARKSSIQHHMEVYHLKRVCNVCGLSFPKREQLIIHRRSAHPDIYPRLKCNQCNFACVTHGQLSGHKKRHLGAEGKDFECLTCGHKFFERYSLRAHEATHAEKGSFACSQCSKVFKTQRRLTIHTQNVHLALKLYECPVCQRKFGSNQKMRQHATKLHPEYQLPPQGTVMKKTNKKFTNICVPVSKM